MPAPQHESHVHGIWQAALALEHHDVLFGFLERAIADAGVPDVAVLVEQLEVLVTQLFALSEHLSASLSREQLHRHALGNAVDDAVGVASDRVVRGGVEAEQEHLVFVDLRPALVGIATRGSPGRRC